MTQALLLPDPRPLVERLGAEFFRQAPERPGVYLMRDESDAVVYVGKAKSLRQRLASYRVANPDRMRRRHLRLLRVVRHIELQECADEAAALAREAELLRGLRPKFNRAGTWPGTSRFLAWRLKPEGLELMITSEVEQGWHFHGPMGAGAFYLRAALVRLLWCAIHTERGIVGMPAGWLSRRSRKGKVAKTEHQQHGEFAGHDESPGIVTLARYSAPEFRLAEATAWLAFLFGGDFTGFAGWIKERASVQNHPFEAAVREADLQFVCSTVKGGTRI